MNIPKTGAVSTAQGECTPACWRRVSGVSVWPVMVGGSELPTRVALAHLGYAPAILGCRLSCNLYKLLHRQVDRAESAVIGGLLSPCNSQLF